MERSELEHLLPLAKEIFVGKQIRISGGFLPPVVATCADVVLTADNSFDFETHNGAHVWGVVPEDLTASVCSGEGTRQVLKYKRTVELVQE